jgi:CPA2 family monovalent cation:H+ antiporter-2
MPPLVGYLVAGVLVGPYTPGFVADQSLALELAEIGVILLMFGVGLHFSLKDLIVGRASPSPGLSRRSPGDGARRRSRLAARLVAWRGSSSAWRSRSPVDRRPAQAPCRSGGMIETEKGRIAVGWLIVEDLAMVLALVSAAGFVGRLGGTAADAEHASNGTLAAWLGTGVWSVVFDPGEGRAFVGFMLVVGRRVIPWLLHYTAHTGSRELFRLAVLAIALGVAFGAAKLFGVSLALGAFFAGMIMSESELSHRAAEESCRCATPSRCCSSSRSACCSTRSA